MIKFPQLFITKVFALLLAFLLLHGPAVHSQPENGRGSAGEIKDSFTAALKEYQSGAVKQAAEKLEKILNASGQGEAETRAKVLLLLGICYEKLIQGDKARKYYSGLKEMLAKGVIRQVPSLPGIDPASFSIYREIFSEESFFSFKEPVAVAEVIKNNVVHAPRKSSEEKKKEKKKKKFPYLLVIGTVVVIGTAAVLLFAGRKGDNKPPFPEIEWVHIPAGDFLMGDNFVEGEADEQPVHNVYLDEYYISKYEISSEQYNWFCEDTGRTCPLQGNAVRNAYVGESNFPVIRVSRFDAQAFCDWLSQREGKKIKLPTEAQWEKAARGTDQRRYPWGSASPDCGIANYLGCTGYEGYPSSIDRVDNYPFGKSPYGVYNMAGNVWEWCRDRYSDSYYLVSPKKNPSGPGDGAYYVMRGGSIATATDQLRSANRDHKSPHHAQHDVGFRVVIEK